jgi:hypothetical protein
MHSVRAEIDSGKFPSVQSMHMFLEQMVETFKDEHQHSLKRMGLEKIVNDDYVYKKRLDTTE